MAKKKKKLKEATNWNGDCYTVFWTAAICPYCNKKTTDDSGWGGMHRGEELKCEHCQETFILGETDYTLKYIDEEEQNEDNDR